MSSPKALDLFCGAGGAAMGLHRAGFDVVGIDIKPQPRYPFPFILGDALEPPVRLEDFDLIWASPPCQTFTAYRRRPNHVGPSPNVIRFVRGRLQKANVPFVIENVPTAPLFAPVTLCGSMFGLDVRRHRIFETSFCVDQPKCRHDDQVGSFPPATNRTNRRRTAEIGVWRIPLSVQCRAMGIDWMDRKELSQAVPPAYSEYIARFVN